MDNPSRILHTLDSFLDHPVRLILYGRAAICLGFDSSPDEAARSLDVDAIIPAGELEPLSSDSGFWAAQEATNSTLETEGLYITHLFPSDMVLLRQDWEEHLLALNRPSTRWLQLFRPATVDLVLTKMMRGLDPLDMADAEFLIATDHLRPDQLEQAFKAAVVPPVSEIEESFEICRPHILAMAARIEAGP